MIQPVTKTFYQTSDGTEFTEAAEAAVHQARLDAMDDIDAYVKETGGESDRNHARLRNTLLDFTGWMAQHAA